MQNMSAAINLRIFCLPIYCPITKILKYIELQFFLLLCVGVKLCFSQWGKNIDWGFWKIGC